MSSATHTAPLADRAGDGAFARAAVASALYALALAVTVRPVGEPHFDPDVWWHLRAGQWVVENRAVTAGDPFSQAGRPWVAYSWLYEALLYGLVKAFGLAGVVAYRAGASLLIVAAVHSLARRLESRWLAATGLAALAVVALAPLMSVLTILFATLTLRAVVELRRAARPPWWVWALPVAFVLWANDAALAALTLHRVETGLTSMASLDMESPDAWRSRAVHGVGTDVASFGASHLFAGGLLHRSGPLRRPAGAKPFRETVPWAHHVFPS